MSLGTVKAILWGARDQRSDVSMHTMAESVRLLMELTKARITAAVAITVVMGYVLAEGGWTAALPLSVLGTFLLASGASALNQWQESAIDSRMRRTQKRPIPSGQIRPAGAFFVAGMLILGGFYLLASLRENVGMVMALGALALVWYNGVYTYLKRVTPFAVVPGALIGAIPPVIGWCAAGGVWNHPLILQAAFFLYIWQIPHFWLLLLMYGEQYASAGLPTLTSVFTKPQLNRITFMWLMATAVTGLSLPALAREAMAFPWNGVVVLGSLWLAAKGVGLMWQPESQSGRNPFLKAFLQLNAYALLVVVCLMLSVLGFSWR